MLTNSALPSKRIGAYGDRPDQDVLQPFQKGRSEGGSNAYAILYGESLSNARTRLASFGQPPAKYHEDVGQVPSHAFMLTDSTVGIDYDVSSIFLHSTKYFVASARREIFNRRYMARRRVLSFPVDSLSSRAISLFVFPSLMSASTR